MAERYKSPIWEPPDSKKPVLFGRALWVPGGSWYWQRGEFDPNHTGDVRIRDDGSVVPLRPHEVIKGLGKTRTFRPCLPLTHRDRWLLEGMYSAEESGWELPINPGGGLRPPWLERSLFRTAQCLQSTLEVLGEFVPVTDREIRHWLKSKLNPLPEAICAPYRASGQMACAVCGFEFSLHPMDPDELSHDGQPVLHVLCSGDRVKL